MENKYFKNGGFPPLKYLNINDNINKSKNVSKERAYVNPIQHNINIRQLLDDNSKKNFIIQDNDYKLEIINNI